MESSNSTTIANVRANFLREKGYQNIQKWMEDSSNIYIGREGFCIIQKQRFNYPGSIWQNPFKIDDQQDRDSVVKQYKAYILEKLKTDQNLQQKLQTLKGKNLGCWCHPEKCHGDILIELINNPQLYSNTKK